MKKNIYKLLCVLALSAALTASAFAAGTELDIWVSKLFTLPAPTVTNEEAGLVVKVESRAFRMALIVKSARLFTMRTDGCSTPNLSQRILRRIIPLRLPPTTKQPK